MYTECASCRSSCSRVTGEQLRQRKRAERQPVLYCLRHACPDIRRNGQKIWFECKLTEVTGAAAQGKLAKKEKKLKQDCMIELNHTPHVYASVGEENSSPYLRRLTLNIWVKSTDRQI